MTKTETQSVLDALKATNTAWKALADSGDAGNWNAEDQPHYQQVEAAIAICEASLARVVEPVAYCISYDGKTVYSNLSCDREYVERMRDVVGGTAQVLALYAGVAP